MTDGVEERKFLIKKGGAYYRPNSQGYTLTAILAGRYSLSDADDITHPNGPDGPRDGMSYIHEDKVIDEDWVAYSNLLRSHKEAVEKAVAEEREAMTHETSRLLGDWIRQGKLTEKLQDAPYVVAAIRARSEQKEGE